MELRNKETPQRKSRGCQFIRDEFSAALFKGALYKKHHGEDEPIYHQEQLKAEYIRNIRFQVTLHF